MPKVMLIIVALILMAGATRAREDDSDAYQVRMVVWRGCEEACKSFTHFFKSRKLPVNVIVTDVAKDKSLLPEVKQLLLKERPDLVVTWGTSVTRSLIGTIADYGIGSGLGDIPSLFMIVADPVRAGIIVDHETSGRPLVTGVHNRVNETVQLKHIFEYQPIKHLAVINESNAVNSHQNTQKLAALSDQLGFEVISLEYSLGADERADPAEIPLKIAEAKALGADALYVGSSSFNLENRQSYTEAAISENLPVFSAYEQMVRNGLALMSVSNSYKNVGKLAASQAYEILFKAKSPGALSIRALERFSVLVNMQAAKRLSLYPPLSIISIAKIVK
ncbi:MULTISPECIES: ABC transporter substrate binding protein [unclassified Pseudovibrio]|uniref:ABC transporter substrate binding protein n=1 Tax=unclassified Pseudovibrio TaxID=2627060 RepID=UPI0007AEBEC3|nr:MULTISPECIES: ABC transporter substrate binding protein [unclassified Pseudovibrio]KZK98036.1 ABC transporter substrate binding protein [Pseudovibrio sp. W74]KZL05280.1 ABC transporter substrate binding protein [Pseudovibrio sp. Ad14]